MEDVVGRVAQGPAGHGDAGARGVVQLDPLVVQAGGAAPVAARRVVEDLSELHPGRGLRGQLDGEDKPEHSQAGDDDSAHAILPKSDVQRISAGKRMQASRPSPCPDCLRPSKSTFYVRMFRTSARNIFVPQKTGGPRGKRER